MPSSFDSCVDDSSYSYTAGSYSNDYSNEFQRMHTNEGLAKVNYDVSSSSSASSSYLDEETMETRETGSFGDDILQTVHREKSVYECYSHFTDSDEGVVSAHDPVEERAAAVLRVPQTANVSAHTPGDLEQTMHMIPSVFTAIPAQAPAHPFTPMNKKYHSQPVYSASRYYYNYDIIVIITPSFTLHHF